MSQSPKIPKMDPATARRLGMVGLGVIGAAVSMGGLLWIIQRQLGDGRLIRVTLVHEVDPATRDLVAKYQPAVQRISDRGVDVNVRLFRRKEDEGVSEQLLTALAPKGAANRTARYLY